MVSALFCGCVTRIPQSSIDLSLTRAIPKNEAVVFGTVKVFKDGRTFDWKPNPKVVSLGIYTFSSEFFKIFVKEEAARKEFSCLIVGDGSFYWHLPKGKYAITGYLYNSDGTYVKANFLPGLTPEFIVDKSGSIVYLGTLVIDMHPAGKDVMKIEDEYDEALQGLKRSFPDLRSKPARKPMEFQ